MLVSWWDGPPVSRLPLITGTLWGYGCSMVANQCVVQSSIFWFFLVVFLRVDVNLNVCEKDLLLRTRLNSLVPCAIAMQWTELSAQPMVRVRECLCLCVWLFTENVTRQPETVETPQGTAQLNNRSPFTCDHFSYADFTVPSTTSNGIY